MDMSQDINMIAHEKRSGDSVILVILVVLVVLLLAVVGVGWYFYFQDNADRSDEFNKLQEQNTVLKSQLDQMQGVLDDLQIDTTKSDTTVYDAPQTSVQNDIVVNNTKTYSNAELGISFEYPSNFLIDEPVLRVDYGDGLKWYRMEVWDDTVPEKPRMRFEINPDGYGPIFADKVYKINESKGGKLTLVSERSEEGAEFSNDGIRWIATGLFESEGGTNYSWMFWYDEGGKDWEPVFKEILQSFRIS